MGRNHKNQHNLSYWEAKALRTAYDFVIVGSGICGSTAALFLAQQHPKARILVLEAQSFGNAASTKNAGFACFGSAGELLDDVATLGWQDTASLLEMRLQGLQLLLQNVSPTAMAFEHCGGWEVFAQDEQEHFEQVAAQLPKLNAEFGSLLPSPYTIRPAPPALQQIKNAIYQAGEGALNPMLMMQKIQGQWPKDRVRIIRNCKLLDASYSNGKHYLETSLDNITTAALVITTNQNILPQTLTEKPTRAARAQVFVSEPLTGQLPTGVFHAARGYAYFRFVDQRLLLGGFRNLFEAEEYTTAQENTPELLAQLQHYAQNLLQEDIEISHAWAGTMSIGTDRFPYLGEENNVVYGLKMGGMGVAIGSYIGQEICKFYA